MKKIIVSIGLIILITSFSSMAIAGSQGELVVINTLDAVSMDPLVEWMGDGMVMTKQMYENLIDFDEAGKVRFSLAVSYNLIDEKTWRLKLRKGVTFHNGDPFTAADVKFTFDRILDPKMKCPYRAQYKNFGRVTVIDDYTVEIETKTPDPIAINKLAFFPRIVPKAYIEKNGQDYFREHPIGTGPFKFVKWIPKGSLILEAHEKWWGGVPKLKRLVFRSLPEMASRVAELQSGGAHIITAVPPFIVPQLEKNKDLQVLSVASLRNIHCIINARAKGPLQDKRVRQAINYAVDKQAIIEGVFKGRAVQTPTAVPPSCFGYDGTIKPYPYDPQKAKALLKEAGYEKGFKLTITCPSGRYPNDREVSAAINEMFQKVGIDSNLQILETGVYFKKILRHELEGVMFIGTGHHFWDSEQSYGYLIPDHPFCHYPNQEIATMVAEVQSLMDPDKRRTLAKKIQRSVHDEAVFVFLYNQVYNYGLSNKVKGFKPMPDDTLNLFNVSLQ